MRKNIFLYIFVFILAVTHSQSKFYKQHAFQNDRYIPHIEMTSDGGWIVGSSMGSDTYLIKYNSCGLKLWSKTYAFEFGEINILKSSQILLSSSYYGAPTLLKLDQNGNVISTLRYDSWAIEYYTHSSGEFANGDLFFTGVAVIESYGPRIHFLVKTDSNGIIKWQKAYMHNNAWGYDIACSDGGILARTGSLSIKTDSLGNLEWAKTYFATSYSLKPIEVSNGFVFAKYGETGHKDTSFLYKLDKQGNLMWSGENFAANYLSRVRQLPNGNFITIGTLRTNNVGGYSKATIIETDSLGKFKQQNAYCPNPFASNQASDFIIQGNGSIVFIGLDGFMAKTGNKRKIGCGDSLISQFFPAKAIVPVNYSLTETSITFNTSTVSIIPVPATIEEYTICEGYDSLKCSLPQFCCVGTGQEKVLKARSGYQYLWSTGSTASSITVNQPGIFFAIITDPCSGQSIKDYFMILPCYDVSVVENTLDKDLLLYPNPTKGIFHISANSIEKVIIHNILGQEIIRLEEVRNEKEIKFDLSQQPKGIYFLEIMADSQRFVKKIVVE